MNGQNAKWPHAPLTDKQAAETFFVVPDFSIPLAFGIKAFRQFQQYRTEVRARSGELYMIGWPDGTTITFEMPDSTAPIDVEAVVDTYRTSATMYRIQSKGGLK
jgi:hypothetical protein